MDALQLLDLEAKHNIKDLVLKVNELITYINELPKAQQGSRDRGPSSQREMTDEDARRVMLGDLSDKSHKECCSVLGLSYGQIYSARKGFTFKPIYKEMNEALKLSKM